MPVLVVSLGITSADLWESAVATIIRDRWIEMADNKPNKTAIIKSVAEKNLDGFISTHAILFRLKPNKTNGIAQLIPAVVDGRSDSLFQIYKYGGFGLPRSYSGLLRARVGKEFGCFANNQVAVAKQKHKRLA